MKFKAGHIPLFEPSSIEGDSSAISQLCTDSCGCNACNELVCSRRDEMHRRSSASEGRFGVAEPEGCASICEGAENEFEYNYDDIGNRLSSFDLGTNRTYTANNLNQYFEISTSDAGLQTSEFEPEYDDDGGQTMIQTATAV